MSGSNQERKRRNVITVSSKQKRAATSAVERGQVYEPNILTVGPIVNLEREKKKKRKSIFASIGHFFKNLFS